MTDNTPAGATPAVAGATPAQSAPAQSDPAPATGTDEPLGDAGKAALQAERKAAREAQARAEKAEKALEELRLAGASESEKAIAKARAEGAAEVTSRFHDQIRRSEVKLALTAAGINPSVVDLAAKADEFGALGVTDAGEIEGLAAAVASFKASRRDLFGPATVAGSADGGAGNTAARASGRTFSREQLRDPKFWHDNRQEILAAQREGRITP